MFASRRKAEARQRAEAERRMRELGERAIADPNRMNVTLALPVGGPARWCVQHGYRAVVTGIGPGAGVIAQRGQEIPVIARLGDALVWDGQQVTVVQK
ncbi:hypothetical protein ACYF6T_39135 [Streptomyces sp. 7R007]